MKNITNLSKKDLARYVSQLIKGRVLDIDEHGVFVKLKARWTDDWSIDLEILQFTPKNEDVKFWIRSIKDAVEFDDYFSEKFKRFSKVKEFQKEILLLKKVAEKNSDFDDLLEQVFDELKL